MTTTEHPKAERRGVRVDFVVPLAEGDDMADDARNVAVLIDFENLNESESLDAVIKLGAKHGNVLIKLAIGNFSVSGDDGQRRLQELGIQPVHQSTAGKGKNSSDMRMAIEAVNLFHDREKSIDVFVLATSDVDFLPLVQWLRSLGKHVVGAGSSSAAAKWQACVDEFVVVKEVKAVAKARSSQKAKVANSSNNPTVQKKKTLSPVHKQVINIVIDDIIDDGSRPISNTEFLKRIREFQPDFSRKTHGFSSFRKVVESIETLHVPAEPKTGNFMIHIRKQ